jgi:serine/threonine-protein kinase
MNDMVPPRSIAGRYSLHREIASGGMASVHLGRQRGAGGFARIVAIKHLHSRYAWDVDFVAMLLDEARLVARIHHPNVAQTLDVVSTDGALFLVMQYIHGDALHSLLAAARRLALGVPPTIAMAIVAGVLRGLQAAHEARGEDGARLEIVHRDVSPQNILVGADGVARIIDFGVAKALTRLQATRPGQLKGKPSYMAPEQVVGAATDARTDVYSASVVLWEALAQRRLFEGETEGAIHRSVLEAVIPPPSRFSPGLSPALDAVVLRGLARDPAERFGSAREMATALERAGAASPAEVASWVTAAGAETLYRRSQVIAAIENDEAGSEGSFQATAVTRVSSPARESAASSTRATTQDWIAGAVAMSVLSAVVGTGLAFLVARASHASSSASIEAIGASRAPAAREPPRAPSGGCSR